MVRQEIDGQDMQTTLPSNIVMKTIHVTHKLRVP